MHTHAAKEFLVQQLVHQAAVEGIPLSKIEQRMMYFTEIGECPEDPGSLKSTFESECDAASYKKKISGLMDHAYRRIEKESPENLPLWNEAFRALNKEDHYISMFWRSGSVLQSPQVWRIYVLGALGVIGLYFLGHFLFGGKGDSRRGLQPPVDRYFPALSPLAQHFLQFLFLLALLFAIYPQLLYYLKGILRYFVQSILSASRQK